MHHAKGGEADIVSQVSSNEIIYKQKHFVCVKRFYRNIMGRSKQRQIMLGRAKCAKFKKCYYMFYILANFCRTGNSHTFVNNFD